jgi:hypothetical protein
VHVWNYHGDVVHARPPFLAIHYSGTGHRIATLPDRWHAYDPLRKQIIGEDATHLRSDATDGASQVLIVGEEADVVALTSADKESVLRIDNFAEIEYEGDEIEQSDQGVPLIDVEPEPIEEEIEIRKPTKPEKQRKERSTGKQTKRKAAQPMKEPVTKAEGVGFMFRDKNSK